jgi:spermidine synthase
VSHVYLETRAGGLRLYLNGDLQLDSRDERLYHEPLASVPTALARARHPARALRVLILGGGDGLALREVLRFPEVREVHLVDRDPAVLRLGATALAELNRGAFQDPRVRVHVRDARGFLPQARGFDVVLYDLTYPGDVAGAAHFTVAAFSRARAALQPGGILAVNAVSPEETPQAFGCVGRTLAAAGVPAVPYAVSLPSFLEEGYGRWGFFFGSPRPIGLRELRRLRLPDGVDLTAAAVLDGLRFPAAAARLMRVAPNRTSELLYYLYNGTAVPWTEPAGRLRFRPSPLGPGPRLTVAEGFARWLRAPAGRRSLQDLLACLPMSWRGQTRAAVLEWSHHAEAMLREVDVRAFVERALRRAAELPRPWVRELRRLRDRLRDGLPPTGELLDHAYRVFAVYLLVLLLVNLFFPDNLYAKGSSSSGSRSGSSYSSSSSDAAPFHGFAFSSPGTQYGTFRYRPAFSGVRPYGSVTRGTDRVYDPEGREHPALRFSFTDPQGTRKPVASVLALTPELQLLDSGAVACTPAVPGYQCLLEPGGVRVLDAASRPIATLRPSARLPNDAEARTRSQLASIDRAIGEHQRWLDWVRWGTIVAPGREAVSEMEALGTMKRALQTAHGTWSGARPGPPAATFEPPAGWTPLFPGVYLEAPVFASQEPTVVWANADGSLRRQSVDPPAQLTDADRFLFRLLQRRLTVGQDQSLSQPVARWIETHGTALGVRS